MALRDDLVRYIQQNLLEDQDIELGPDDSLLDAGLMDSIGLMRVLSYLENDVGVRVPDARVTPENFETVSAIERMVAELKGTA